ncbi:hypothetical protein [Romboutsia sp. 1001216sp1]|uniref:hypothetical protein n=1 Tax=Romboutsia sp. 1001216sp1 TaxID=2986997 RepID=UPI0023304E2F|nr:hypothetical protein [Romboutsia sp. 1001216sp1]MDB8804418.1 hypothetical protein [Romboutsia sp. 1001216sp1]MDB8806658.1 hypothetical protein [Romboutsia sp. 1001216sp1]MDB8810066.1 hypothetical protein [Romboutsia sp. 1001216sp1]MDB8815813.1 hypothetical protein [Romboutsia sp. 1001216sp1]MDB8818263.1 hypothetical protein [Romboutsia sp. 1001216sp1]
MENTWINNIKALFSSNDSDVTYSEDVIKNKIVDNDICIIGTDITHKVRIRFKENDKIKKVSKIKRIVTDINNLPMSKSYRKKYSTEIATIYQLALNDEIEDAEILAEDLKKNIEGNIIIQRKIDFIAPAILILLLVVWVSNNTKYILNSEYYPCFIYGPIGGILSLIINQNNLEINYNVNKVSIYIESIKMVISTLLMSLIGFIAIKSGLVLGNIDFSTNSYVLYFIIIICGYSQTFVPNILNNFNDGKDT